MAEVIAPRVKRSNAALLTEEILDLVDQIHKNADLARKTEKELGRLRKRNEKSFAAMQKALVA